MTENENSAPEEIPEKGLLTFDPEEMNEAAAIENADMQSTTINYLNNRVVVLRAGLLRLRRENEDLKEQLETLRSQAD